MANKKTYKLSFFSYFAVSLVVFTVFFTIFTVSYAYFRTNQLAVGNVTLGEIDFQVLNSLNLVVTSEQNLIMPGEVIVNQIEIVNARDALAQNYNGLASVFLKIRPTLQINNIDENDFLYIELTNPDNWIQGADGFLYYTNKILAGGSVQFNDYFIFSNLVSNEYEDLPVYIGLEIETIQSENQAYLDVWDTAPAEWVAIISTI